MTVEAPAALEQQIQRREFGDHQVEVEVETLLDHLRGDQHRAKRPIDWPGSHLVSAVLGLDWHNAPRRAEASPRAQLAILAFGERESSMQEIKLRLVVRGQRQGDPPVRLSGPEVMP